MSDQSATSLLQQGRLADAIATAQAAVRKSPINLEARMLLAELLAAAGNLARADVLLDAAAAIDSTASLAAAEFRQLIRAEIARRQLFQDGRVPNFLSGSAPGPTPVQRLQLAAIVALRAGDEAEAARQSELAEATRPRVPGYSGETAFDDFRDADDILAGSLEILTSTGKYYWIPTERVVSAMFHPPIRLRDLIWRRVSMIVSDGPEGDVYMPVIYSADDSLTDAQRLGRETDWRETASGLVRGVGQRIFLAGENGIDAMALTALRFDPPNEPAIR